MTALGLIAKSALAQAAGPFTAGSPVLVGPAQATVPTKIQQRFSYSFTNIGSLPVTVTFTVVFKVGTTEITASVPVSVNLGPGGVSSGEVVASANWTPSTAGAVSIVGKGKVDRHGSIPGYNGEASGSDVFIIDSRPSVPISDDSRPR